MKKIINAIVVISIVLIGVKASSMDIELRKLSKDMVNIDIENVKEVVTWNPKEELVKHTLMHKPKLIFVKNMSLNGLEDFKESQIGKNSVLLLYKDIKDEYGIFFYTQPNCDFLEIKRHNILMNFGLLSIDKFKNTIAISEEDKTKLMNEYIDVINYLKSLLNIVIYDMYKNDPNRYNRDFKDFSLFADKENTFDINQTNLRSEIQKLINNKHNEIDYTKLASEVVEENENIQNVEFAEKTGWVGDLYDLVYRNSGGHDCRFYELTNDLNKIFMRKEEEYDDMYAEHDINEYNSLKLFKIFKNGKLDYLTEIVKIFENKEDVGYIDEMSKLYKNSDRNVYIEILEHAIKRNSVIKHLETAFKTNNQKCINKIENIFKKEENYIKEIQEIFNNQLENIFDNDSYLYSFYAQLKNSKKNINFKTIVKLCKLIDLMEEHHLCILKLLSYNEVWTHTMTARYIPENFENNQHILINYIGVNGKIITKHVEVNDTNIETIVNEQNHNSILNLPEYSIALAIRN